jgi:hypothetical protein
MAKAKNFRLRAGKLRESHLQTIAKFRVERRARRFTSARLCAVKWLAQQIRFSPAKNINRPLRGNAPKQPAPILNRFLRGNLHRGDKRFLKTIMGVGVVSDDTINRLPYDSTVRGHDSIPIRLHITPGERTLLPVL